MRANSNVKFVLSAVMALIFIFSCGNLNAQGKEPAKKQVYKTVENMPVYPGGDDARVKFMIENVKYPAEAIKKNTQGTVFVDFIVQSDGALRDVKVQRGIGSGCDEEAVRVIKLMPKWVPGTEKGKPVDVQFVMPVKFKLDAEKEKPAK